MIRERVWILRQMAIENGLASMEMALSTQHTKMLIKRYFLANLLPEFDGASPVALSSKLQPLPLLSRP